MDDAFLVGRLERIRHLARDGEGLVDRETGSGGPGALGGSASRAFTPAPRDPPYI